MGAHWARHDVDSPGEHGAERFRSLSERCRVVEITTLRKARKKDVLELDSHTTRLV